MIKVYQFLPKYPQINKNNLKFYNENFNQVIFNKKEFYENKLDIIPKFPDKGEFMKHQKIIARFLSSNTPYNELLIFHEMGTGKSCAAIAATELLLKEGKYTKILYLAPSETLIENFKNELINKCTNNKYNKSNFKKHYMFNTYEKFSRKIEKKEISTETYNNFVIILDEVHNISSTTNSYPIIKNFLRNTIETKIMLLSGTPMVNSSKEMLDIMNFILPKEIDTEKRSINKEEDRKYFKEVFKGRISYLKAKSDSDVKKIFMGKKYKNFEEFKLVKNTMSSFQSNVYNKIISKSIEKNNKKQNTSFYLNEIQASLFVYPDGSVGTDGFRKYIKVKKSINSLLKNKLTTWKFSKKFASSFKKEDIKKYSSKYAQSLKIIEEAKKENKIIFVYNSSVEQSGIILFSLLLELYGYSRFTNIENTFTLKDKERYILLTGNSNRNEIKKLIDKVNNPNNKEGKKIRVILGSSIISEGFTFKNIQKVIIQTPHWNYSKLSQAIARSYRAGSHKDLEYKKDLQVEIYQQVAIPDIKDGYKKSIDIKMYKYSEEKDIEIKKMERLIKEISFDCALNYDRNRSSVSQNKSRECEYSDCNYKCDGIISNKDGRPEKPKKIDYSTYNLYYSENEVVKMQNKIILLFKKNFKLTYNDIKKILKFDNDFMTLKALQNIINKSILIYSKYGMKCYLREHNNIYYLVNNLSNFNDFFSNYYVKFPFIINENIKNKINNINNQEISQIRELCEIKNKDKIIKKLYTLQPLVINSLIEQSFIAKINNININKQFRDNILDITKDYIINNINFFMWNRKVNNSIITKFNFTSKIWENIDSDSIQLQETILTINNRFEKLDNNKYKIYGIIDYETKEKPIFKIKILDNKKNKGKNINSFKSQELVNICAKKLKLNIPIDFKNYIKNNEKIKEILKNIKADSNEEKIRILYWDSKRIFNKHKLKTKFKIKVDDMRKKIKLFLFTHEIDKKISLVQNQKIFDIYKFYSELE